MRQVMSWYRMARLSHVTSIDCMTAGRVPVGTRQSRTTAGLGMVRTTVGSSEEGAAFGKILKPVPLVILFIIIT